MDPSKKVPDLSCEVQDLLFEVVDLKQEVPDLRSGGIPPPEFNPCARPDSEYYSLAPGTATVNAVATPLQNAAPPRNVSRREKHFVLYNFMSSTNTPLKTVANAPARRNHAVDEADGFIGHSFRGRYLYLY